MDYKNIRATARRKLAGNWALSIGVAVVAALLGGMVTGSSFLPDMEVNEYFPIFRHLSSSLDRGFSLGGFSLSLRGGIFGLIAFLVGGAVELGHAQFLLKQHDGRETDFSDLFSQFYRFGQGFAQKFLRGLYTFLWMLLLIVPGIVKAFSYAMTPFIMADHPELSASEAINRSKEMMDGHKWDLFVLDLTFIGWVLLCGLTMNIGFIVLNPYLNAAYTVFYRQISGQTRYAEM